MSAKILSISVFITGFKLIHKQQVYTFFLVWIAFSLGACKDIVFNNPLDPNGSKDVVKVIKIIDTPLSGIGDLTFDGEKLWKINPFGNLTAVDRETGTVIRSFFSVPGTGISFYGDAIYIAGNEDQNIIVTVDPLSGDVLTQISARDVFPRFLAAGNGILYVYDERSSGIFQFDPIGGDAQRLFELSGLNIGGMAFYKGGLLISDMNSDSLYRFTISGEPIAVYTSPAAGIGGLSVDNSDYVYLFTLDGNLYKVTLP
jgi:outer membrane protein assembly factor BamB